VNNVETDEDNNTSEESELELPIGVGGYEVNQE
jgi:hypothetical protein